MSDFPHWVRIIVLIVVGVVLVFTEFFVPGLILGTLGVASLIGALVITFKHYPDYALLVAVIEFFGTLLLIYGGMKLFPKTPIGRLLILNTVEKTNEGYVGTGGGDRSSLVGQRGKTTTMLRPSGFAEIGGERIDVVTEGDFIEPGIEIEVLRIEGNRVVVRAV